MAKYEELISKYQTQVDRIRELKAQADALLEKINQHDKSEVDYYDDEAVRDHQEAGELVYRQWQAATDSYNIECDRLTQDINAEYNDVPFAKHREQGIKKFWELVGA